MEINGKYYAQHRLAWFYHFGKWPSNMIDHIDRDKANNRIDNLRLAKNGQNRANSKTSSKHGLKGIRYCDWMVKKPWEAKITFNKKVHYLGCFPTAEEAHEAYKNASDKFHKEFSNP